MGQGSRSLDRLLARAFVPQGPFLMGSSGGREDEEPVHCVFVSTFEMALTPVTREHYALFLQDTGAPAPPWWQNPKFGRRRQPVVGISWFEARAYCEWLAAETGWSIRLPTEAEREKAARGGLEAARFPWGNDPAAGGHRSLAGPLDGPEEVASTAPNGYGLFNMGDTVHEWCLDGYDAGYYARSPDADPCAPETTRRSARGGSWRHQVVITPCAARSSLPPGLQYSDFGFRWLRADL